MKSVPLSEATFDLPQILEDEALRYSTIRRARSRTINGYLKRQSMEQSDSRATWPAFTTKQRLPLPWDSCAPPKPVTIGRSSSARIRRNIATISASNPSLCQSSSVRKLSGKHYIERKTLTIEIQRKSTTADWGLLSEGACAPRMGIYRFLLRMFQLQELLRGFYRTEMKLWISVRKASKNQRF